MPKMWLCCGGPSDDVPSYEVQVSNSEGQIWKSTKSKRRGLVHVAADATKKDTWELERDGEKSWWSYHVKSKCHKLYVSYDKSESTDEKVTLEHADSGKERYFVALLQPTGGFMLADINNEERVLWVKNGQLCMIHADQLSIEPSWFQTGHPFAEIEQVANFYGEVMDRGTNKKWKSADARPHDPIAMTSSTKQEWSVQTIPSKWIFGTVDSQTSDQCYASGTSASPTELMFAASITKDKNLGEFTVTRPSATSGLRIKSMSSGNYIGKNDTYLQLEESEEKSVGWEFVISQFVLPSKDGTSEIFPGLEK